MLLTTKQKLAYQLRQRDFSDSQIATELGIRRESVNRIIARANKRLQEVRVACLAAGADCKIIEALLN